MEGGLKVLIADQFSEEGMKELEKSGIQLKYDAGLNGESLTKALGEFQPTVLVVRSTKVTKADVDADPKLQLVVRAGAGYDTIDVAYCAKQGVYVANCPGKNSHAVAELTLGLILSIDRRIPEGVQLLREQKWNKGMFANCTGIKGRTLGLIGFGNIAQLVMERAKAFEMNVLVHTRTQHPGLEKKLGFQYASSLEDLLKHSDIVSIHTPATAETKNLVNKEFLSHMKKDAVLLNTSRGTCVNEDDLLAHLEANKSFWFGTDVFNGEPAGTKEVAFTHPLAQHPRVYGSHHIGASTKQSEGAIGEEAVRIIKKYAQTGAVDNENCVNRELDGKALHKMTIRHYDKVGVLAHTFAVFAKHQWNVQELENIVFKGREACVVNIKFTGDTAALAEAIEEIKKNENVIDISV
jgi:D-3-phosphoglycerate dehydrogenase